MDENFVIDVKCVVTSKINNKVKCYPGKNRENINEPIILNNNFNGDEITQKFAANSTLNYKKIILFLTSFQYLTLVLPCHIYRLI